MFLTIPRWPKSAKTAFAWLLVLLFVSETTALAFYSLRIGHGNEDVYYQGTPEDADIDLDEGLYYPKSTVELLEVAHPHTFGFVLFFALLSALALAMPFKAKWIQIWTAGLAVSILGFLAVPFVIRFVWSGAAGGYGIFGALISAHVYVFIIAGLVALTRNHDR